MLQVAKNSTEPTAQHMSLDKRVHYNRGVLEL